MKIEILCMENKQPTPASASSEGSANIFLYSPQLKTPAPAHRYLLLSVNLFWKDCALTTTYLEFAGGLVAL